MRLNPTTNGMSRHECIQKRHNMENMHHEVNIRSPKLWIVKIMVHTCSHHDIIVQIYLEVNVYTTLRKRLRSENSIGRQGTCWYLPGHG